MGHDLSFRYCLNTFFKTPPSFRRAIYMESTCGIFSGVVSPTEGQCESFSLLVSVSPLHGS